ncbi:hypothetical protein [Lysinibacillus sp. 54212]|uniref:hypothetical protein n=1 Tax=Lysinibacillus sp. 54212 TaxID=3119829 RepID=UPI002FCBA492
MNLYETIKSFIDKVFSVPISFLDLAIEKLGSTGKVIAQGLNVSSYLSIFGDLPSEWQLVLTSLLISMVLFISLFLVIAIMRMYYAVKEGVQWW